MEEKIELIKKLNVDDSNFIIRVYEALRKNQTAIEEKKKTTKIVLKKNLKTKEPTIDLDKIDASPYLYTNMRKSLERIIKQVKILDKSEIEKPGYTQKVLFEGKEQEIIREGTDLVEVMKSIQNQKITLIAEEINEESLFKEEQIKYAEEIFEIKSIEERNKRIYEIVYEYLKKDFVGNDYCDFKDDRCVAQRNNERYPKSKKNGCCFNGLTKCGKLRENGECVVKCMACRLYACPYLTKRGIGYWAYEIPLLKAFFSKKQRGYLVNTFFKKEESILKRINRY